jgi:hypothetical protein
MSTADDVKKTGLRPGCKSLLLCAGKGFNHDREAVWAKNIQRSFPATIPTSPRERTAARKIFTPNNLSIVLSLQPDSCHLRHASSVKTPPLFCLVTQNSLSHFRPELAGNWEIFRASA